MTDYAVEYDPRAIDDLDDLYFWLAEAASVAVADRFLLGLAEHVDSLSLFPHRSTLREDIRPGLRVTTFRRAVWVAYVVQGRRVRVLRVRYRGARAETLG